LINDTEHLYHYFNNAKPPLRTITSLPFDEAFDILTTVHADSPEFSDLPPGFWNRFLQRRYDADKILRDKFISVGGKPVRTAPIYFTLGENEGMKTWYDNLEWIKIPVIEFDPDTISFTYGDSFAVFNPDLDTGEEYWGQVYFYDEILNLIDKYGYPEDPPYDMKNKIFPKDKPINQYLKYIEAHVWSDEILDKYR